MKSGIYCIQNKYNDKNYIGQAFNLEQRFSRHIRELNKNVHPNKHLQHAWNIYGKENFIIKIIEECKIEILDEREMFWILKMESHIDKKGYNMSFGGCSPFKGRKHTAETKQKMSKAQSKENHPLYGKHPSEETRRKMRENKRDISGKNNPMFGKKGVLNPFYGKHLSEEAKRKMRENRPPVGGEKNPNSKLTEFEVLNILDMFYNKKIKVKDICYQYKDKISIPTIKSIVKGKNWKIVYEKFMERQKYNLSLSGEG